MGGLAKRQKKIIIITAYESVQGLEMVQADVVQIDVVQNRGQNDLAKFPADHSQAAQCNVFGSVRNEMIEHLHRRRVLTFTRPFPVYTARQRRNLLQNTVHESSVILNSPVLCFPSQLIALGAHG